jgi:hypothetical protein
MRFSASFWCRNGQPPCHPEARGLCGPKGQLFVGESSASRGLRCLRMTAENRKPEADFPEPSRSITSRQPSQR